jgi:hypothetical protein
MYKVRQIHVRPAFIYGVKSTEFATLITKEFKTKKSAKEWISSDIKSRRCVKNDMYDMGSYELYTGFTSKTWFDEGAGETRTEQYQYKLSK